MGDWEFSEARYAGGRFQLVINKMIGGAGPVNATTVRGAPTQFDSYTDADPFGDATAQFSFPAITPFDDLNATDLGAWLGYYSNVDLFWVPEIELGAQYAALDPVINAITNQPDVVVPSVLRDSLGNVTAANRIKLWEGFIASMDFSADGSSAGLQITCQGALFQLDRYLQKPFFPVQPWPLELLIADAFNRKDRPPLRILPLQTHFPVGWGLVVPKYTGATVYTSVAKPGSKWSGYASRQTGSWDHTLTGFVQDQLSVMLTDKRSGVTTGNQWTIAHQHEGGLFNPGRQPVLLVRDRYRTPDFSLWVGTPGLELRLSGDSTQSENVVYGDGVGVDGTVWRNAVISNDGSRTDYLPLAASRDVYPATENKAFVKGAFLSEAYTKFGTGFDQPDAVSSAEQALARDRDPGWSGTITLSTDPSPTMPRWTIRAGMTVLLKGFAGSGQTGVPFHIASRSASPMEGTVELTVDTRYRDLLTVEEAQARTRDPLTPVKMLQVNRTSVLIEDAQAPWDYSAGSGYIPRPAQHFYNNKPRTTLFPYHTWARLHPPLTYPQFYVRCHANAPTRAGRWAGPVQIITSEKDTIARTEVYCVDVFGRPVFTPFHVSIYYFNVTAGAMPRDGHGPSPYINGAFESTKVSGVVINPLLQPPTSFIVGWGNQSNGVLNRAGFSPGRESDGGFPTGELVDESAWQFDNTTYSQFFKAANPPGAKAKATDISLYAMFYCEHDTPVYFQGRLFRQNPGVS